GVRRLWSSYFKQGYRALQDTAVTPIRATYDPDEWKFSTLQSVKGRDGCALFTYTACNRGLSPGTPNVCSERFLLEWSNCESKAPFSCRIPAQPLKSLQIKKGKRFEVNENLGFEMFFTDRPTSNDTAPFLCRKEGMSTVYSISSPADRAVLTFIAENVQHHLRQLGLTQAQYETGLFWVQDLSTPGCDALLLQRTGGTDFTNGHIVSWPCDKRLRALCKAEVSVQGTKPPELSVTPNPNMVLNKEEVRVHSDLMLSANGMVPAWTQRSLRIVCKAGLTSTLQNVTFFRDNTPVATTRAQKQSTPSEIPYYLDEALQFQQHTNDAIEITGYYHCEVNDLKTNAILKSNRLFLQPTDFEIYSARFELSQGSSPLEWNTFKQQLLFDSMGGLFAEGHRVSSHLNTVFGLEGYKAKIVSLTTRGLSMMAYIYRKIPYVSKDSSFNRPVNKIKLDRLKRIAKTIPGMFAGSSKIRSVSIQSIDHCLKKNITLLETVSTHHLPDMPSDTTWTSTSRCSGILNIIN
ncbi:hypothetical protein EGW08_012303, partial [Elysia chlorotica]